MGRTAYLAGDTYYLVLSRRLRGIAVLLLLPLSGPSNRTTGLRGHLFGARAVWLPIAQHGMFSRRG